jgi:glycosyltransferase involved in cell wall biosynthesis
MTNPLVSIVIPAYNQADYLGATIESVLNQTYQNIELIVVNDASPDNTTEIVERYDDPRLKYIIHEENRHLAASRNTGLRASSGEIVAVLDADDLYHPQKIELHVQFLEENQDIGVSYNARFEIDHNDNILDIWCPPLEVDLSDLIMGFPFAPSDMVMRREWAFLVDLFDESFRHFSEDLDINCRLALAGSQFANVGYALNYRRYYPGRMIRNSVERHDAAIRALSQTFHDPRCPQSIKAQKDAAFANVHMVWSYEALINEDSESGIELFNRAIRDNPQILKNDAEMYKNFLNARSIKDGGDHEHFLGLLKKQMAPHFDWFNQSFVNQVIGRGYLELGVRSIIWDREADGKRFLNRAVELGSQLDQAFMQKIVYFFMNFEAVNWNKDNQQLWQRLLEHLKIVCTPADLKWIQRTYYLNRAFAAYRGQEHQGVIKNVINAAKKDVSCFLNRGVMVIFFRSLPKAMGL